MFYTSSQLNGQAPLESKKYMFRDLPSFSDRNPEVQFSEVESLIIQFVQGRWFSTIIVHPRDISEKVLDYTNLRNNGSQPNWITILSNKNINEIPKWVYSTDINNDPDILEFTNFILVVGY